jgi:regulator of sigma E protease
MFDWLQWLGHLDNFLVVVKVLIGLNLVIFVHELGHFAVAKMCGVKCEKFYVWFDPPWKLGWGKYSIRLPSRICKFQWGETEYGIGVLPLGGYVKMLGQDDNPTRAAEAVRQARLHADAAKAAGAAATAPSGAPVAATPAQAAVAAGAVASAAAADPAHAPADGKQVTAAEEESYVLDPRSYMAKSVPQRMAIISAGVVMNIIFAIIFATIAYSMGVPSEPAVVAKTVAGGGAWRANFHGGDRIVKIRDKPMNRFVELRSEVTALTNLDIENGINVVIERAGNEQTLNVKPESLQNKIVILGVLGPRSLRIADKTHAIPNSPAAAADFQNNDVVEQVNGKPVNTYVDYLAEEARDPRAPLKLVVRRGGVPQPAPDDAGKIVGGNPVTVTVAPRPYRDLGFHVAFGPIKSVQDDSPAAKAGVEPGDELVSVNGTSVSDLDPLLWPQEFAEQHSALDRAGAAAAKTTLVVKRAGKTITLELIGLLPARSDVLDGRQVANDLLGVAYEVGVTIGGVDEKSAAAGKIRAGDRIIDFQLIPVDDKARDQEIKDFTKEAINKPTPLSADDEKKESWPNALRRIQCALPTTQVCLTIGRGDSTEKVTLPIVDRPGRFLAERGLFFEPWKQIEIGDNLGQSLALGWRETSEALTAVVRFLRKIWFEPGAGQNLGSVLTIGAAAGMAAKEGFADLLIFMTLISANLAVINFLPIPVLDGGHMVFLAYEGIRGKPADERVFGILTMIGFVLLLSLMVFVFWLDINRFFMGG